MTDRIGLQLFAESGDGGGAAPAAAAAETMNEGGRLRELGVPEDVIDRRSKRRGAQVREAAQQQAPIVQAEAPAVQQAAVPVMTNADVRGHFESLQRQGREMAGKYAGFDLQRELDNPVFFKLTGPDVGLSVEDAFMAVHHRELTRAIAEGTKRELSNAIRAGAARPGEHGIGGSAAAVTGFDYRNADRAQRRAFKQEIYNAAARGQKIYPGR